MKENILIVYEASITILNPVKDCTKRENCNSMSLMNIDTKVVNISKRIYSTFYKVQHDRVRFISGMQGYFKSRKINYYNMPC